MKRKEIIITAATILLVALSILLGNTETTRDGHVSAAKMVSVKRLALLGGAADIITASEAGITSSPAVTSPAATVTPGEAVSPTAIVTPRATPTATPKPTATPIASPTPSLTPSVTPTGTVSGTPTPSVSPSATPTPGATATPIPTPVLLNISVSYKGGSVVIGDKIDKDQLTVTAIYNDGTYETVTSGYQLPDTEVTALGVNRFVVVYRGKTAMFFVQGIQVTTIIATCQTFRYGLYNGVSTRDITVRAIYSDGSTRTLTKDDYTYFPKAFTTTGSQEVTVNYKNVSAKFYVYVDTEKKAKTLSVSYEGGDALEGEELDREKIFVTVVYDDVIFSSERIETYTADTLTFTKKGANTLNVKYRGLTASCTVNVIEKVVTDIRAEYKGEDIEVGDEISEKDIFVYVKYNDKEEVRTQNYGIYDTVIRYLGENTIKIYIGDKSTTITVNGIEAAPIDFSYVSDFSIKSGEYPFFISTAIPKKLDVTAVAGKLVKKTKLTKAFRKLKSKTGWFCGFDYEFADDNNEVYLPLMIRITLPSGMEAQYTELYYTPNCKSIVGKMNKRVIDTNTMEVLIFKTGIYMLVNDPAAYEEEPPEPEDSDD